MTKSLTLTTTFIRSQIAAFISGVVDYGTLLFCVEILKIWYVTATAIGAVTGAIVNFTLGRFWSFKAEERSPLSQAWKYALVSAGSLALNVAGVAFFTETVGLKYWISKLVAGAIVAICYNFTLQRFFVFKH